MLVDAKSLVLAQELNLPSVISGAGPQLNLVIAFSQKYLPNLLLLAHPSSGLAHQ